MNSNQPNDVIDQMVELRLQRAQLDQRIEALKPAFHQACTALDRLSVQTSKCTHFSQADAWAMSRILTLFKKEKQLKRLKRQFQEKLMSLSVDEKLAGLSNSLDIWQVCINQNGRQFLAIALFSLPVAR